MNSIKLFLFFTVYVMTAESLFFDGGLTVVGGGWALAALLGLKAAALGGVALGLAASRRSRGGRRHYYTKRRYGRSVEDETDMLAEILLQASRNDEQDCAKKLVCVLNAQNDLAEDETKIAQLFGKSGNIDLSAVTVEFDLAALIGQQAGEYQCNTIYSRCPYQVKDLMEIIRQPPQMY